MAEAVHGPTVFQLREAVELTHELPDAVQGLTVLSDY